jgi:uncharacterized membrane protein
LAVLAQAVAAGLSLLLARGLSHVPNANVARFSAASAAMQFPRTLGHAANRWLYHQGGMDNAAPFVGLEGVAQALWPMAFVLIAAEAAQRAPARETVRPYHYDVQAIAATAVWPALGFAALGMWLVFNPWWGAVATAPASAFSIVLAPATPILAAWLSCTSARVAHVRWATTFERVATVATIIHLLVGVTLIVRWLYHRDELSRAPVLELEMWSYSAAWALFGAGLYALGMQRDRALLRQSALTLIMLTVLYVMGLAFFRLEGFVRAGSVLGLAIVVLLVAWFARTYRPKQPTDLMRIKPSARRERRHGRRQRSP